jgi:hypothetical protein
MCIHIMLKWAYGHNWHVSLNKYSVPSFTRFVLFFFNLHLATSIYRTICNVGIDGYYDCTP